MYHTEMRLSHTETFIIPVTRTRISQHTFIAYSPLSDTCCLIDQSGVDLLHTLADSFFSGERNEGYPEWAKELLDYDFPAVRKMLRQSPQEYTTLSLLPNLICNFRCQYCYSAQGRSHAQITREKLRKALDFFIDPQRICPQTIKMFVSGGGEPLLSWETIKYALEYAYERARQYGFTLWVSFITNGAILEEEILHTLKTYACSVCVSFEVLPELQEHLRGQYEKVSQHIISYGKAGIPVMLNSTITPFSVDRMQEMMEEVLKTYPFVRNYTLEPVTDHTLFGSPGEMREFYRKFATHYRAIKELYGKGKTSLWFSLDEMADTMKMRYCPGKLCLTPQGTFSICHCASSPREDRYEKCVYGSVTEEGVTFDTEKFRQLMDLNVLHKEKCRDCFAKWNCGGECMTRADQYPEAYMEEVCHFNREWLRTQLEQRISEAYAED